MEELQCYKCVLYGMFKNSHGVRRHMDRFHSDLIEKYNEKFSKTQKEERREKEQ